MRRAGIILLTVAELFCWDTAGFPQGLLAPSEWASFHARDISNASKKFGLSIPTVETLIRAVDREDGEEDQYSIQRIDALSLKQRGQILLALTDFGTANSLEVNVIDVQTSKYVKVWSTREIPEWKTCRSINLSTESMLGKAVVSAGPNESILIKIPLREEKPVLLIATFIWSAKTYKLVGVREFLHYKGNGSDWEPQGAGRIRSCAQ